MKPRKNSRPSLLMEVSMEEEVERGKEEVRGRGRGRVMRRRVGGRLAVALLREGCAWRRVVL